MNNIDFKENAERHSNQIIKLLKNKKREFPNVNQYSISLNPAVVMAEMAGIVPKNNEINPNDLVKLNKILKTFNTPQVCPNSSLNLTNMLKGNLFHNPNNKLGKTPIESNANNNCNSLPNNAIGYSNPKGPVAEISEPNGQSSSKTTTGFISAFQELKAKNSQQNGSAIKNTSAQPLLSYGASKRSLGTRRNGRGNFVPPIRKNENPSENNAESDNGPVDERLLNIDPKMIEMITNEIMHKFKNISWNDIAGLDYAKSTIKEAVVWPMLRPDIFTGLRRPPRGILLFGPPGTGKTLIGKCIASQSKSTFFSISASSLTSKWVGDGEKMVRALFAVAAVNQPSVVFIDEIDSLLSQRSESEHESSRRIKTEFLVQLDGAATSEEERILIVGATNRPQELDEAARRRLVRRLYIPLPDLSARVQILNNLLKTVYNNLMDEEVHQISKLTEGYSGADMETLCREASLEPIRSIDAEDMAHVEIDNVRPVNLQDFYSAIKRVRPSVSQNDIKAYLEWNNSYGAGNLNC